MMDPWTDEAIGLVGVGGWYARKTSAEIRQAMFRSIRDLGFPKYFNIRRNRAAK